MAFPVAEPSDTLPNRPPRILSAAGIAARESPYARCCGFVKFALHLITRGVHGASLEPIAGGHIQYRRERSLALTRLPL
jgi:hypothetical protein